ncbi:ATP-binding protein [Streptomyces antimycoticus]
MAAATGWTTWAVSGTVWIPVASFGAVATLAAGTAAAAGRARQVLRLRYHRLQDGLTRRLDTQKAATVQLADQVLPEAVVRLQQGDFLTDVLVDVAVDETLPPELQTAHRAMLGTVLGAVAAEEDLRESAQRAIVNIARRVQAVVHQQAQDLRRMEDRHGNSPDVFGDLLRLDHGNALVGRLADSIAVLGGARPGRQWSKPVPLFSVLRGAISRILDYQRVELGPVCEVAVVGTAVEPLIHTLAELLDNATRYSPPQTRVHLTATEVQSGIAVEIEDGGLSMSEEARARAERMLEEAQAGIDLKDLGEAPRLGLAVVGRLSQAYGFSVSLRSSAYGGVRAVLIVPQKLITSAGADTSMAHGIGAFSVPCETASAPARAAPAEAQGTHRLSQSSAGQVRPQSAEPIPSPAGEGEARVRSERTASGLPQRRRSPTTAPDPVAAARAKAPAQPLPPEQSEDAVQPGIWLAAFSTAVSGSTPAASGSAGQDSDVTSDKGEDQ